jgi:hypothetical protein
MKATRPLLLVILAVLLLALVVAPAALAKSQPVTAAGSWTWENTFWGEKDHPSGNVHLFGYETGAWTGTLAATDTYEPYVAGLTRSGELMGKLWIHFTDAAVDMGGGVVLHGDMTMMVLFRAGKTDATWMIHNGSGELQHLGGEGTLLSTDMGMDYTGVVWTNK